MVTKKIGKNIEYILAKLWSSIVKKKKKTCKKDNPGFFSAFMHHFELPTSPDRQMDKQKVTPMSLPCKVHRWVKKVTASNLPTHQVIIFINERSHIPRGCVWYLLRIHKVPFFQISRLGLFHLRSKNGNQKY